MKRAVFCALLATVVAIGQQAPDADVLRMGPGITSPKLLHKTEPAYSEIALRAHVQGLVLLQIVIDDQGSPQDITVLSPLGFGLDERAIAAVSGWRFKPGERAGRPVKIRATVEISFRLLGQPFDQGSEERRTSFNAIASRLSKTPDGKPTAQDVTKMQDLAKHKLAAASCALGIWQTKGLGVPQDAAAGLANLQQAADKQYGPAMYFVGKAQMEGEGMPKDAAKGLALIRDAAVLGSPQAQFMLGGMYEKGADVEADAARSRRYFRLCAAVGKPECQFRLGRALIISQQRKEADWLQGIAWLKLAQGHGFDLARQMVSDEEAKLTPEQSQWVMRLKGQLERKTDL